MKATLRLLRNLPRARRTAVERGEVRRVWPDALLDMAALAWWRGIYWPVHDRIWPPLTHAQAHPDCPACSPKATYDTGGAGR